MGHDDKVDCIFCHGTGKLAFSEETRKLAQRAVEAQRNDTRTMDERIRDGVSFILWPDAPASSASPLISAKGRKPTGDVLLLTTSRMWIIGDWYKGAWRTHRSWWEPGDVDGTPGLRSAFAEDDITHWTPLPDPDSLAASATSPQEPAIKMGGTKEGE